MTEGNEVEELTNAFRELITQQRNLKKELTKLNDTIENTNERLNLLINSEQESSRKNEVQPTTVINQEIPFTEQHDPPRRGNLKIVTG
jgi:chromosome segregation ATPase